MSRQLRTSMEMLMDSIAATERDQSRPFHLIRGDAERVSEELSTLRAENARLREDLATIALMGLTENREELRGTLAPYRIEFPNGKPFALDRALTETEATWPEPLTDAMADGFFEPDGFFDSGEDERS